MKYAKLLEKCDLFKSAADNQDAQFVNLFYTKLPGYKANFAAVVFAIIEQLREKRIYAEDASSGADPLHALYQLKDMVMFKSGKSVPNADEVISLTKQAWDALKQVKTDPYFGNAGAYLYNYAQALFRGPVAPQSNQQQDQKPGTEPAPAKPAAAEQPYQFISRMYRQIGKPISDADRMTWVNSVRQTAVMRFNGLRGIQNRTPAQQQEVQTLYKVIQYLG